MAVTPEEHQRALNRARVRKWYRAHRAEANAAFRHRKRLARYGVTKEEYEQMVEAQNGRCAICDEIPKRTLAVDHDHATGKVRGLLCQHCNHMIGCAKDNPSILNQGIEYLRRRQ